MTRSRYVYVYNLARDSVRRRRTIMLSKHLVFFASGEEDAIARPEVENITSLHPFIMLQESDNLWWDAFATEFFEDDATLTLTFCLEDGPKRYSEYSQPPPRIQSLFPPLLLFFLKVRITLFSVENVENAFSSATEKTPLRLLVFPSGRHGSSSRSIVPMHARTTRLHTHSK